MWTRIVDTRVTDESVLSFTYEHYDTTLATFPGYDGYVSTRQGNTSLTLSLSAYTPLTLTLTIHRCWRTPHACAQSWW